MEKYHGIKFQYQKEGSEFDYDHRLEHLNQCAWVLAQLGLTPIHGEGAYGNLSYRLGPASFIISKTGMIPEELLVPENFVQVESRGNTTGSFLVRGLHDPSSECFLHAAIYDRHTTAQAVLHGHSLLFDQYAEKLDIGVTSRHEPYGTLELAESALTVLNGSCDLIMLKDHGFVAVGRSIREAGNLVLEAYQRLLAILMEEG